MRPGIPRFSWLKVAAACAAVGLHAVVLAMVLSSPVAVVAPGQPDALDIQFVELAPEASAEASAPPPEPDSKPLEPPAEEPAPEPEPVLDPDPAPPEVQEPEPEALVEPPPLVKKPRPVAKPKPRPVVRPHPQPKRQAEPRVSPHLVSSTSTTTAGAAEAKGAPHPVDPDRPRVVGQVDYLGSRPAPVYPRASERRGEQGRVILRVLISPEGRVVDVKVQKSSGYSRLDQSAILAMRQARFRPYTENGIAYPARVDIPFDFVL